MKLKDAINVFVSHNALVVLEETDPKDSHYTVSIYEGMVHEIPNELLEREMFPITDVVGDPVGRLHIQLKTDFEAADEFLLFTQLPNIDEIEKDKYVVDDLGYIPTLYYDDNNQYYVIDWINDEFNTIRNISGITPEGAIRKAFKWCLDNNLIVAPNYNK